MDPALDYVRNLVKLRLQTQDAKLRKATQDTFRFEQGRADAYESLLKDLG